MPRFYLTTAIDYPNGEPHLGHAVEKVGADVIARYRRSVGDDVRLVIGMDEHGQKVAREAESHGATPQEWVDRFAELFRQVWSRLDISHDDFIRTTEERHRRGVTRLMERIREKGDFYLATYEGYYCSGCEAFKKEEELVQGQCPLHPNRDIEWTEEKNWFFKLSAYRDPLLEHIRRHPEFVRPASRRNEILRLLETGLDDISASRSRIPWGVPFPGTEDHTVYVWFDALPNYITAVGYGGDGFEEWWPAALHIIGKDITRFHCVIWPAMLMSAGVDLPAGVWAHGFINIAGGKLSKSTGKNLELPELIERHGPDALRYFLMREVAWDGDRDFASVDDFLEQFDRRYTTDLANDLGNLLNRVVAMVSQYRDGHVAGGEPTSLDDRRAETTSTYREKMDGYLLHHGVAAAFELVRAANGYVDEARPWELAKQEKEATAPSGGDGAALDDVLGSLLRALGTVAALLSPFIPAKSDEMWATVGGTGPAPALGELEESLGSLGPVRPGPVLFPRPE